MIKDFVKRQQEIIDQEMRDMDSDQVNEVLETMTSREADRFLERLGHLRAKDIYDRLSRTS